MSVIWADIAAEIKNQMAKVGARILPAGSVSDGKITLRIDPKDGTPASELFGMLLPFVPAPGEDAVVIQVGGKNFVLGGNGNVAGPRFYKGSADPNGSITAETGSLYSRTSANGGSQWYVKVSGSGNTGWLPSGKAPRRRARRDVLAYQGASLVTSFVTQGFQSGPTITASAHANADDSTGFFLQHNTSSSSGNDASVVAGANSGARFDWSTDISFGIRTPQTITSIRQWYGMFGSSPAASDDPAIEGFGFRFSTNAGDTNWQAWSNDGTSTGTVTDTGVAYAQNTGHELRCVVDNSAAFIDFFIDGNWVARHTTNLPAASTVLDYGLYVRTLTASARAIRWGRITMETEP